ncbi:unnamed protein product [Mesocestoides corti]|nr:unnamed protein product [Mesocestoides corti]
MEQEYRLTKTAGIQFKDLNRYADMLPYDQSMVILGRKWPSIVEDPEPQITAAEVICGYINASYIRRPRFGPKGEACVADPSTVPEYIASQGPLTHTIADFLTMVYEQKSKLIVMLCR